ncbi:Uu.00g097770.m01.CDS01 [Anthostomella pinea]|uniref:Uu.00g097770.m01.CDS01 n=1 Tax=Anthostomella pinea TaxID=933095 RepID=A0AAI8YF72_9PEZI|nr:Uu.00g097770.m01.CDS01 [Anthostomella pinea]
MNRLIDEGAHAHLNRRTVGYARDELGKRGNEFLEDIHQNVHHRAHHGADLVRKVSKRSLRSRQSHESSENERPQIELHDMSPPTPPGAGLAHENASYPHDVYTERECVMGQTVPEEGEEFSSMDGGSDMDYGSGSHSQDHNPFLTPTVRSHAGSEEHEFRGSRNRTGDYVIDMERHRREHGHHASQKVRPAEPDDSEHRGQHGHHAGQKIRPAEPDDSEHRGQHDHHAGQKVRPAEPDDSEHRDQHGHHTGQKVRPADLGFEDVDLADAVKKSSHWGLKGYLKKD